MLLFYQDKSAASLCHHVTEWVTDMLCNFYLDGNHKIVKNSETAKARENKSAQIWNPYNFLMPVLRKIKKIKFYLIKLVIDNQNIYRVKYPH